MPTPVLGSTTPVLASPTPVLGMKVSRALQLRREAQMVSPAMGAAMIGTIYFLRVNCAQHGESASGGDLISASLLKLQGSIGNKGRA